MRCLDKWTAADGNTYNLVQINDYSIIPSSVISATTYADKPELIDRVSSLPNYVTSTGDKFGSFDSTTINAKYFANSEYLDVAISKYSYNDSVDKLIGTFCRELVYQNKIFGQTGWSSLGNIVGDVYYGVIIDDINNRAYIIELQYITNHPTYGNVWYIYVIGGKANGIDVIWQTFQPKLTSNGGGATHIAKRTGQLKDLSSYTSDILMVSGGGGGGLLSGETDYSGKEAGGISGSGDNSADQSTGNAFGQGESGTNVSGGGSGLYGGYKGTSSKSGGAGSGYIGNSLLSNKKMVGYNVPTSSAESTKTESVNEASESPVSGKPKSGNGFARIKFLREPDYYWITQYTVDGITYNLMQIGDVTIPDSIINATQMTCTAITGRSSTIPSFITNLGDLIFDLQSSIDADVTLEFINNSFLRFLFGRYNYITSGTRMNGSQYYDVANSRVFYQSGWGNWGDGKVKYYIAIKIDKVNHRAYMIVLEHTYYHWAGNIGYTAYAIGGMPNGVDLLYETFKDVR